MPLTTSRPGKKQLNALVSEELFDAVRKHCVATWRIRDKTVEQALWQFLESHDDSQNRRFFVELSPSTALELDVHRRLTSMPDRNRIVDDAIHAYVQAQLRDAQQRDIFNEMLVLATKTQPN
ncbi:MAG: hypothetical protein QOI58_1246 [Thermoanaerobaculia bacterium]|jgi:hypothetical protein|nr:hypothetical protein [Thermoanaerobaculia bacterium]